ncbi:hypothetical protein IFR05_012727 [Cadophora sp. M221]|nr:hypothetical protein IFR05_012727 [Cadophora sp. M221]
MGMSKNSGRYIPAPRPSPSERGSRESTVSVEDEDEDNDLKSQPRLQLTFDPGPKAGHGITIGTHRNRCDIVLPKLWNISGLHCVLPFDAQRRLILKDLSRNGTIVEYNGQGGDKRRVLITYDGNGLEKHHHFTWILNGGEVPHAAKNIVIQISQIKFRIIVASHEIYYDLYHDHVDRFLREANANNKLPLGALGIQSTTSTAQQSGAYTPTQTPIYIN